MSFMPDAELNRAFAPVLADFRHTHPTWAVRMEETGEPDVPLMLWLPGGIGTAIKIPDSSGLPARVRDLAEQFQDAVTEELWSAGSEPAWPPCPRHPGSHPLEAVAMNVATWRCPMSGIVVAQVGQLGGGPQQQSWPGSE